MDPQSVAAATITLKELSDDRLLKVLDEIESELENETLMQRYPERANELTKRSKKVREEMNRRVKKQKDTRRQFVIRWLKHIEIENIDPLELD